MGIRHATRFGAWIAAIATVAGCEKTGDCPDQGLVVPDSVSSDRDIGPGDPGGPADVGDANGGDNLTLTACQRCLQPGLCFRFDQIEITEPSVPEGLPDFLNQIWTPDINAYRLNIMFCIDSVHPKADGSVVLGLQVIAGAAWHDLPLEQVLPVQHQNKPSGFHFVEGFTTNFEAEVDQGCTFRTIGSADLWFHPGPADHALVCSAGDPSIGLPVDTIPIEQLVAHGQFDDTCTRITAGQLGGCISSAAACQICSFILAPDYREWNKEPDTSIQDWKPCEASYCNRHCGYASGKGTLPKGSPIWTNFGGFVQGLGVPIQCDTDGDGTNDGYSLAGNWTAVRVPYLTQ